MVFNCLNTNFNLSEIRTTKTPVPFLDRSFKKTKILRRAQMAY